MKKNFDDTGGLIVVIATTLIAIAGTSGKRPGA